MHSAVTRVPVPAIIDAWTAHDWSRGVSVDRLLVHERFTVRTLNSVYEFIVTNPRDGQVLVRGGQFFPEFTAAQVAGCSLGGSFLKVRGVHVGFRIEILSGGQTIITSPVNEVAVSGANPASVM